MPRSYMSAPRLSAGPQYTLPSSAARSEAFDNTVMADTFVMARLVRATYRGSVLAQVARTSRAMTVKGSGHDGTCDPPSLTNEYDQS